MIKEDFSLKKDVLQIQKKVTDLELTATELKEALTKFDTAALDELKQRVDDVEDLSMVENAAVIELKNMLQGTKPEQPQETVSPQLEERLNALEQKISGITVPNVEEIKSSITASLPSAPTVDTSKLDETVNEIKAGFESLKTGVEAKITSVEGKLSSVETMQPHAVNELKEEVKNYILSSLPDNEWIKNELHSFKSYLDAEKIKLDSLMQRVEKDMQMPLPEKAVDELEKIRNDWMVNMAKIDAVEKFVENFSNEMSQLKPIIKKLETFEKLMDLQTEITEKLDAFKEYRDHIENAMAKNEDVEKRIQREVSKMKNTEKMFSQIDQSLSVLSNEMEKNKREMDETVSPLEDKIESTTRNVKDFQDVTMNLDKRLDSIEKTITAAQDDMSVLQGSMMALEGSLSKKPEEEDKIGEMISRMNELQNRVQSIRASSTFDEQFSEIVSRLVFLESRLAGMEGMMQDNRYAPIVVE